MMINANGKRYYSATAAPTLNIVSTPAANRPAHNHSEPPPIVYLSPVESPAAQNPSVSKPPPAKQVQNPSGLPPSATHLNRVSPTSPAAAPAKQFQNLSGSLPTGKHFNSMSPTSATHEAAQIKHSPPPMIPTLEVDPEAPSDVTFLSPSSLCCNNSRTTVLHTVSQMVFNFFGCGECCKENCRLCKMIKHNGRASSSNCCRYHNCTAANVETIRESEAGCRKLWIESNHSLKQLLEMEDVKEYLKDPMSEDGVVGRNINRKMSLAKTAIETTLVQTNANEMGKATVDGATTLSLNSVVLSYSQVVEQPPYKEVKIPKKQKPKSSNETPPRESVGVHLLLSYYFGPFLLSLFMETIGIRDCLRKQKKMIEVLMKIVTSPRSNYSFCFDHEELNAIIKRYEQKLKRKAKKNPQGWKTRIRRKLSVVVWATRFIIDSLLTCGTFGVADGLVNLLSIESNTNHHRYSSKKDREYLRIFAALSYMASFKTRAIVDEARKGSLGNHSPAMYTDSNGRNSSCAYLATLMITQMNIMSLLFRHGILGSPDLSNAVIEMNPLFSEIMMNRTRSLYFKNKVTEFVGAMAKSVRSLQRFDAFVGQIMADLVLDSEEFTIRTIPFFYLNTVGSYLIYALPQLEHVFHNSTLIRNTSMKQNQVLIVDRRGDKEGLIRPADTFHDFYLESSEFAVEPCDSSMHVLKLWEPHIWIAVTPATHASHAAFSFNYGNDRQLIYCLPPRLRLEQLIIHAQCLFKEHSQHPSVVSDTTLSLGISRSQAEVLGACYDLILRSRNSLNQVQATSYTVRGSNTFMHGDAVESLALLNNSSEGIAAIDNEIAELSVLFQEAEAGCNNSELNCCATESEPNTSVPVGLSEDEFKRLFEEEDDYYANATGVVGDDQSITTTDVDRLLMSREEFFAMKSAKNLLGEEDKL